MNSVVLVLIFLTTEVLMQTSRSTSVFIEDQDTDPTTTVFGRISNSTALNTVRLPKCCPYGFAVAVGNCTETVVYFEPKFNVHDHNETAFDNVSISSQLISFETFIHYPCMGKKFPVSPDEDPKILLNGSLLLGGFGEYDGILGHDQFCIDNLNDTTGLIDSTVYAFVCVREQNEAFPQWVFSAYMTLITMSALLFTSSVVFFHRQEVEGNHKRSYMVYAISMSASYVVIVLMQFIPGLCKGLGLLLQLSMTLTFSWLAVLCFDLAWAIHFFRDKDNHNRFIIYLGTTAIFSILFLIISLLNNFTPDIPVSFFKPQFGKTTCSDIGSEQHKLSFLSILVITMLISVISLLYSLLKMNRNRYRNTSQGLIQWKRMSKKFRYMYGRILITFVTMAIWFLDSFSERLPDKSGISTIILFIQAFQGFVIVPLFTMKSIQKVIEINKKPRIENLQELMEVGKNLNRNKT